MSALASSYDTFRGNAAATELSLCLGNSSEEINPEMLRAGFFFVMIIVMLIFAVGIHYIEKWGCPDDLITDYGRLYNEGYYNECLSISQVCETYVGHQILIDSIVTVQIGIVPKL